MADKKKKFLELHNSVAGGNSGNTSGSRNTTQQSSGTTGYKKQKKQEQFLAMHNQAKQTFSITGRNDGSDDFVGSFLKDSQNYIRESAGELSRMNWMDAMDAGKETTRAKVWENLRQRGSQVRSFLEENRAEIDPDRYRQVVAYLDDFDTDLKDVSKAYKANRDYFSQWDSQKSFDDYQTYQRDREQKKNLDLDAYSKEIAALEQQLEEYDPAIDWTNPTERKQYDQGLQDLEGEISRRKQYLTQAQRVQQQEADKERFAAVRDQADFAKNSGYDSSNKEIGYRYVNADDAGRLDLESQYGSYAGQFGDRGWDSLSEEEKQIYNYYMNTGNRDEAADYLRYLEEALQLRKGTEADAAMDALVENDPRAKALRYAFMANVGYDQHLSGMRGMGNMIAGKEGYVPPSSAQVAGSLVREDLSQDGRQLPQWLGGGSTGQMVGDLISTTANMAPSMAVGLISPNAGAVMMGASAAGGAYQEKINEGYSKEQARKYGIAIGASETALGAALGGIKSLGGAVTNHVIENALKGVKSGIARAIIEFGARMGSEALEEGIQEILTPVFSNMLLNTDEDVDWSQVAYSALLGGLSAGVLEGPSVISDARNATQTPNNATELPTKATTTVDNTTEPFDNATEAVDNKKKATVSKKETIQMTGDIESFSRQFGKQAEAVKRNYLEGQDLQEYEVGFQAAYAMGKEGGKREAMEKHVPYLSQSQREIAFNLGAESAAAQKAAPTAVTEAQVEAGIQEAQHYGSQGYSLEQLKQHGTDAAVLTDSQQMEAWEAGRQIHLQKAESAPGGGMKASGKTAGVWFDAGGGNVRAFDEADTSGLSETALAGAKTAKVLQKLGIGRNYYFFESYKNKAGDRVYRDENGVEKKAPNGWYDPDGSIHIDLNAGANANGLTMYTLSHELTHFVEKWSPKKYQAMADFLVANYAKAGNVDAMVAEKQAQLSAGRGSEVSYEEAYSEFIADSMEAMLSDGNVLEKLQELKKTDKSLYDKIREFFDNLGKKIREIYKNLTPDSLEGQAVLQMKDQIDQIQQLFAEGLVEAGENFQAAAEAVLQEDAEAVPAGEIITDGAVVTDGDGRRYSIRSMKSDIAEGQMFDDLQTYCNWSKAQVDQLKKDLTDLVDYMTPFRDVLDLNETYGREGRRFSPYKPNSDPLYQISMDFSTLCSKRLLTQFVIENLQLRENRPMTAEEQMAIRDMLIEYRKQEKGLQVACAMCYVEAARLKSPKQMQRWLNDPAPLLRDYFGKKNKAFNDSVKKAQADFKESRGYKRDAPKKEMKQADIRELNKIGPRMRGQYQLTAEEAAIVERAMELPNSTYLTAGNLAALSESDPAIYDAYTSFVRTATRSKSLETDEPYYYGDSRRDNGNGIIVSDSFIEAVNRENGMRFSSWSDWRIQHMLDYITAVIDNAVRGAAMHGYTKFPEEVRVLGKTGMMFNLSGVAGTQTGLNEDGSLSFSPTESIDKDEAVQLREDFPETAGLQCIGVGDDHIRELMKSDIIDYIIPYHVSGLNKALRTMADIQGWKDYTGTQHASIDHSVKLQDAADPEHWHEEPVFSEFFVGYDTGMTGIEAMRESAERYRQMCHDRGLIPKFNQFYEKGNNYWKLLIDRKMINQKTGKLIQQKPVTPTFDFDEIKAVVKRHVDNYDSNMEARALNHIVENWDSIPGRIKDLKKTGNKKAAAVKAAVDTVANEMLAAQRVEGRQFSDREQVSGFKDYDITAAVYEIRAEKPARGHDLVKIGAMPELYKSLFGLSGDVYVSNSHLYQNMVSRATAETEGRFDINNHADYHDLGEEKIINAIEQFQDPVLLMESLKDYSEPRLVAVLDEKGNDGQNLIAVLELYAPIAYPGSNQRRNHVLMTIYEKNSLPDYIEKTVEKDRILHKKQGLHQTRQASVQFAGAVSEETLKKNVARFNKKVKAFKEANSISYQDRSTGTSNRALLAGAFEELVTSPDELKFIRDYQENISLLNEQEAKLQDIRTEIREISFGKGPRDSKRLQQLQEEATKTANRIDIYDRKLLKLERAKPPRDVLDREREKVRKATRKKGQEVLENYREKRKESAAKKDARRKIRKTIMDLNKLLNRGDKKKNVKDGMTAMVGKSLKLAEALFMDEYSNRDMLRNGLSTQLTDAEEAALRDARQLLERIESGAALEGKTFASEIEAQDYLRKLDGQLSGKMAKLKDAFARERKMMYGATVSDLLGQLADEYNRLSEAEDGAVRAAKDENVYAHLLQLKKDVGGTTIRDMTLGQMEAVADAFTMVLTTVRNANKLFAKNLNFKRDVLAKMVMGEIWIAAKKKGILEKPWEHAKDSFFWNNLKPVYAFSRLGSETLRTLYQNIRKGQDTWAVDMQEADAFRREQYRKHKRKGWDLEKQHSFEFESGRVQLSLEQIMSLYAYSRREQAMDHLLKGGFVFSGSTEVIETRNGIKRRYLKKDSTAYNLTADELLQVIDTLSAEQKAFVEEMQTYLSDVMGGKGNEVSLQMYGIKSFGEKNYFPLRSAGQYMEKAKEDSFRKEQGQISIVNSGFTKAVAPKANNPITLDGFMDVWAEHVNDMAMYHGFVLPMEDFRRVYNYSSPNVEEGNSQSVNATIENAHGKAATAYIDQLYKDLNGGAVSDNRENLSKKLVGLHKKAAVFASASVVIQQPSAIVRAFAVMDPKHFIGPKVDHKRHKLLWEEVKKYAPVAFVKEMGYFDTGMGRSAKDYLQAEEYSGIREKMAALFKDAGYRDEVLGKAPALADEYAWCSIWEAVKRETRARNPGMNPKSDAFLQMAGERFAEVIDKTQVYDSVLSRSANMRSKALHMNMLTSFLAEPTTSINMLEDALRSGDRKQIKRTVGAVYGSVLLNSMLVSLVYAARDDDEDETWWEKYLASVATKTMDGINPITYYPFLRDIWSIGQGYDVERADMSLISDFAAAAKKVISAGMKLRDADEGEEAAALASLKDSLWGMADSLFSLTGLPVKNIRRDIEGARNMVKTISADLNTRDTSDLSLRDAVLAEVMDTIPIGNLLYSKNKRDRLYGALVAGDNAYVQRLKAGYESDSAYHSAIWLALRDNDSRIWEAAIAWNNNDLEEYKRIAMEIIGEKHFIQDDIVMAIRAEASSMVESESSSSSKVKGYFTNEKLGVAMAQNNTGMVDAVRKDLVDTAMANGKTRDEAEDSVRSTARSQLKQLYAEGTITGANAEKMLVKYGGYDSEDAAEKVAEWKYEKDFPELDGRITYTQYKRWETDGKNRGIDLDTFTDVAEYRGGDTSSGVRSQEDVADYINGLPISTAQKDALWCCFWAESTLYKKAPWH